ncbi:MAG TPA: hypothetical protein VNV86_14755 [Candidatus Acidoferrum sp.]|nr:hypothetical protein [Candidatus Acidoferrum sp.]
MKAFAVHSAKVKLRVPARMARDRYVGGVASAVALGVELQFCSQPLFGLSTPAFQRVQPA